MDGRLKDILDRMVHPAGRTKPLRYERRVTPERLVVGLGSPGAEYRRTRHNVGFMAVEELAKRWDLRFKAPHNHARAASGVVSGVPTAIVEPLTFMNVSGRAVSAALRENRLVAAVMIVAHDDVDLPFGRIRLRPGGSAAGHRGIISIIESVGTQEFARLRLGIGRPSGMGDVRDYVLAPFEASESEGLRDTIQRAASAIECYLTDGMEAAMNRFNG
jgi:peptidyl-tRNA hydrolase, PTH1 family